ncbi:MAG: NAD(P)/FAD-dependent oxidoreductase [Minisyncoccia bacterium]|jgi:NADH dehydrogenase
MLRPHIVILGTGFGGVYVAKRLAEHAREGKIDVTLVGRNNYFLFTPLLHEAATGALSLSSVAEPLREIFVGTGVHFIQGTAETVDAEARTVEVKGDSAPPINIRYDYLVIGTGAETNYYGIRDAAEYALPLKTLADAATIRNRVIDAFEKAALSPDRAERAKLLSFAVVGGGPTGVELAAELAEFTRGIAKRYYSSDHSHPEEPQQCQPEEATVSLVHAGKEILEQFSPNLRQAAAKRLKEVGVAVHTGMTVTGISSASLYVADNPAIPASTVIWTAGVKAVIPKFKGRAPALTGGRLSVDSFFRLPSSDHIFALGDAAAYIDAGNVKPLPMLAQVAEKEAKTVARNLIAIAVGEPLRPFRYRSKGGMVSVGQWFAIGELFSKKISGRLTWWLWRTVYLSKFASWRKRIRIAFEWALELFFPRDITKLS